MKETKVTTSLNTILADIHILNVKLHAYHWNISGIQFHAIHEATEGYYNYFFAQFDEVAERILQLESKPASTTKAYLELATIEEDEGTQFDASYVLNSIVSDFTLLLGKIKEALALAEEANDPGTQDLLGGQIAWLEKEIWILKSTIG